MANTIHPVGYFVPEEAQKVRFIFINTVMQFEVFDNVIAVIFTKFIKDFIHVQPGKTALLKNTKGNPSGRGLSYIESRL